MTRVRVIAVGAALVALTALSGCSNCGAGSESEENAPVDPHAPAKLKMRAIGVASTLAPAPSPDGGAAK